MDRVRASPFGGLHLKIHRGKCMKPFLSITGFAAVVLAGESLRTEYSDDTTHRVSRETSVSMSTTQMSFERDGEPIEGFGRGGGGGRGRGRRGSRRRRTGRRSTEPTGGPGYRSTRPSGARGSCRSASTGRAGRRCSRPRKRGSTGAAPRTPAARAGRPGDRRYAGRCAGSDVRSRGRVLRAEPAGW